jgi:hypothetical protein
MFDDVNLHFTRRRWDQHPERIVANDMRRDSSNLRQNDNFGLVLDTFHDKRNGFLFYVTPIGGMFDARRPTSGSTTPTGIPSGRPSQAALTAAGPRRSPSRSNRSATARARTGLGPICGARSAPRTSGPT